MKIHESTKTVVDRCIDLVKQLDQGVDEELVWPDITTEIHAHIIKCYDFWHRDLLESIIDYIEGANGQQYLNLLEIRYNMPTEKARMVANVMNQFKQLQSYA